MPIYAITYDLNKDKDYPKLWKELERLKGHKAAKSFYLLSLNDDSSQVILDHLKKFIDENDTMIVLKAKIADIKAYRGIQGTANWLKTNSD